MPAGFGKVLSLGLVVNMVDRASASANRVGRALGGLDKAAGEASIAVAALGSAVAGLFLAGKLADAISATVREAADFEFVMTNVSRIVGDTAGDLADLNEEFLRLSTQIPASAQDLGTVATQLARMGLFADRGADEMADMAKSVVIFATASGLPFQRASTNLGVLLNQFKLLNREGIENVDSINSVASALLKMEISSLGTSDSIFRMTQRFGALSRSFDLSIADAFALSAAIQNLLGPTRVEPGGSALLKLFVQMATSTAKFARVTGIARTELEKFKAGTRPAIEFVQLFGDALNRAEESGKGQLSILKELQLADSRQILALSALGSESESLNKLVISSNIAFNEGTEALNQYQEMMTTLVLKTQQFRSATKSVLAAIGPPFIAAFGLVLDVGTKLISLIVALPSALTGTIAVMGAFAAAMAIVIFFQTAWALAVALLSGAFVRLLGTSAVFAGVVESVNAAGIRQAGVFTTLRFALASYRNQMLSTTGVSGAMGVALGKLQRGLTITSITLAKGGFAWAAWNTQVAISTKLTGILTKVLGFAVAGLLGLITALNTFAVRAITLPIRVLFKPLKTLTFLFAGLKKQVIGTAFGFRTFGRTLALFTVFAVAAFAAARSGNKALQGLAITLGVIMLFINPIQGVLVLLAAALGAVGGAGLDLKIVLKDVGEALFAAIEPLIGLMEETFDAFAGIFSALGIFSAEGLSTIEKVAFAVGFAVGVLQIFGRVLAEILEFALAPMRLFLSLIGQIGELFGGDKFTGPGVGDILSDALNPTNRLLAPFGETEQEEPTLVRAARGGIVRRPTRAIVGEGGSEEAIVPLTQNTLADLGKQIVAALDGAGGGRGRPQMIEVHITSELDGVAIAEAVHRVDLMDSVSSLART